jgi:hypothetical protein
VTVLDFHPDDLIDRDARGLLSADEKRRLGEHLAQCVACRMELSLRADFDAELGARASGTSMQDFVTSALIAAQQPASPEPALQGAPRGRRVDRRVLLLVAASFLLVSGLAAAQAGLVTRVIRLAQMTIGSSSSTPRDDASARKARKQKPGEKRRDVVKPQVRETSATRVAGAAPASALPGATDVASTVPSVPTAAAAAPAPVEHSVARGVVSALEPAQERLDSKIHTRSTRRPRSRHARAAERTRAEPAIEQQAASASSMGAPAPSTAEGLFERAGQARREGRWLEASGLYRELAARFGRSAEARLSLVLVARMQLDRGEPRAALEGFEAYLASSDAALREEALAGRALAYKRLGRATEERESVRALLREYPDSPYGRRALERLERGTP